MAYPADTNRRKFFRPGKVLLALALCMLIAACGDDAKVAADSAGLQLVCADKAAVDGSSIFRAVRADARRWKIIEAQNVAMLQAVFERSDYDLESIRNRTSSVPRLILASLPPDIEKIDGVDARKAIFISTILPAILQNNERIVCERRYVLRLKEKLDEDTALTERERMHLKALYRHYRSRDDIDALLARADIVPPSLAIAQAAIESGWGTSRFAMIGNALFGQRTTDLIRGLRPTGRSEETKIRVRAFEGLAESVAAYALNLNTHGAYEKFRADRASLRRRHAEIAGMRLAETLTRYSERGGDYLHDLMLIIATNRLHAFDGVQLKGAESVENGRESDA
ncbi:MAG: glucosaminidase domain-containing protein [Rhodospirillales bacterium]